jgi:hypothetical protein
MPFESSEAAPTGGTSRATRRAVLGAACAGLAVGTGTLAARGAAEDADTDARVLNFVLLVEHVERAFYREALRRLPLRGELREFAETAGAHEAEHVRFLRDALGARARNAPRIRFGDATRGRERFVETAVALEDLVVSAYNGQATNLTPATLAAAARIVSVEARHAAWIRDIAGRAPAADAVDTPRTSRQVLDGLRRAGVVVTG